MYVICVCCGFGGKSAGPALAQGSPALGLFAFKVTVFQLGLQDSPVSLLVCLAASGVVVYVLVARQT